MVETLKLKQCQFGGLSFNQNNGYYCLNHKVEFTRRRKTTLFVFKLYKTWTVLTLRKCYYKPKVNHAENLDG